MRTKHAILAAAGGVMAALLSPSVAIAGDSDNGNRAGMNRDVSNPNVWAEAGGSRSGGGAGARQAPKRPTGSGGGGSVAAAGGGGASRPASVVEQLCDPAAPSNRACEEYLSPAGDGAADVPAAAAPVDAPRLAERALNQVNLPKPTLNTSPADPVKALVGLETWLWVPQDQWQTLTASASAGGATVTVTAEPIQVRWDMGEDTVNCAGPGREWRKGLGQNATTPCSYTYKKTSVREPGKKHNVSTTIRYRVPWTCEGDCNQDGGDLGTLDSATSTAELEVSERQSVVIR